MKSSICAAVALLASLASVPASAQNAQTFTGGVCEIDTTPFKVSYLTPDGTRSVFTNTSTKLCTGVASKRNVKLECTAPLPGWTLGDRQAKNFVCTINGDQCGLSPKATDKNAPYLTATQSILKVVGGVAQLSCFYKP
jgi:hypothetical protein